MQRLRHPGFAVALAVAVLTPTIMKVLAEGCPAICPGGGVPIGISTAMTGPAAPQGQEVAASTGAAVNEINSAGGLIGVQVQGNLADDRCDPQHGMQIAQDFISHDVKFVVGPICTPPALASAEIYARGGVLQILPFTTVVDLTRRGYSNLFRLAGNDDQEIEATVRHMTREQREGRTLAIVRDDTGYGRTLADSLSKAFPNALRQSAPSSEMEALSVWLSANQVQLVYAALSPEATVRLSTMLRTRGERTTVMSGSYLLSATGAGHPTEGTIVIAPAGTLGVRGTAEYERAVEALGRVNATPDRVTLAGYTTIQVWAEAVRRANGGALGGVERALQSEPFNSAIGPIAFDERGDRRNLRYSVFRYSDGQFREYSLQ
jgi:branched-chain amino acid transport system substrate-binding protein